jgi:mxaJ protein
MVNALAHGDIDAALVWGPQAGYFAARSTTPMQVTMASAPPRLAMPFEFAIALGLRHGDRALRDALDAALIKRRADIDAILAEYAVPRVDQP